MPGSLRPLLTSIRQRSRGRGVAPVHPYGSGKWTADQEKGHLLLGLAEGTVALVDHDPSWARAYGEEERRIKGALAGLALDVQHCGSTAVPGIKAKPILDIVVGVERLALGRECVAPLRGIGYAYLGDALVPDEHFFGKGSPRTHHLHIVEWRRPSWDDKVLFRDRLLADPILARAYEATKVALAHRFPSDRASYTRAKAAFITGVVGAGGDAG